MGWLGDRFLLLEMRFYEGLDALRTMNRVPSSELLYDISPDEINGRPESPSVISANGGSCANDDYARRARDGCPCPTRKPIII